MQGSRVQEARVVQWHATSASEAVLRGRRRIVRPLRSCNNIIRLLVRNVDRSGRRLMRSGILKSCPVVAAMRKVYHSVDDNDNTSASSNQHLSASIHFRSRKVFRTPAPSRRPRLHSGRWPSLHLCIHVVATRWSCAATRGLSSCTRSEAIVLKTTAIRFYYPGKVQRICSFVCDDRG